MAAYAPIKIYHSPMTNYIGNAALNYIGAQSTAGQRGTLPIFTNANTVFIAKTGSDFNPGTQASPMLTLNGGMALVARTPNTYQYVCIMDSGVYSEYFTTQYTPAQMAGFIGIYAADGQTPTFTRIRGAVPGTYGVNNPARAISGTVQYYISKAGNDRTGVRGNAQYPFLTIQAALNDSARQVNDTIQIQDSGVYHEDINFGTIAGTVRAALGVAPTLRAFATGGPTGQITWNTTAQIGGVDGLIIDGSGSVDYAVNMSGLANQGAGTIIFSNCSFVNQFGLVGSANVTFNNCFFSNTRSFVQHVYNQFGPTYPSVNNFYNCYFQNTLSNLQLGWAVTECQNCTFNNVNVTGAWILNTDTSPSTIGAFSSAATVFDSCFFNNSSLTLNWQNALVTYLYTGFVFNPQVMNCIFYQGTLAFYNNSAVGTGAGPYIVVLATVTNTTIYAEGQVNGLTMFGSGNTGGNGSMTSNAVLGCTLTNVVVSNSQNNNFWIERFRTQTNAYTTIQNCTSISAGGAGFVAGEWPSAYSPDNFYFNGNVDAGSPVNWAIVGPNTSDIVQQSESGNIISTSAYSENCTLSANDFGNFSGPNNTNGGSASMGYDWSLFDISFPCILNGLTFAGWTYPNLTPGNMEGGVQSSANAALQIQNCTFNTSGTFAIKAPAGSTITNCLFNVTSGHAIATNQNNVTATNNVGYGCAGAFIMNYGQNNTFRHNTAYNCEYGEYDSFAVSIVTTDSNIFNGSGAYDYSGNGTVTYSCVGTIDPYTYGTVDIYGTRLDPLFRDANSRSLGVQSEAFGYFWNSPCIQKGSDGQDIGAYAFAYGAPSTSWTLIDFSVSDTSGNPYRNPDRVIRRELPIKLAEGEQENGAVYSVASTYKRTYEMTWGGDTSDMPIAQTEALTKMFLSFTNQIRVDFGDGRGPVPAYFKRQQGFEYTDMTGGYSMDTVPQPVKEIVIQEA